MFVDHVSNYIYVHLMKDFTTIETLLAKLVFKKLCTNKPRGASPQGQFYLI
jgi:hypothetical protein